MTSSKGTTPHLQAISLPSTRVSLSRIVGRGLNAASVGVSCKEQTGEEGRLRQRVLLPKAERERAPVRREKRTLAEGSVVRDAAPRVRLARATVESLRDPSRFRNHRTADSTRAANARHA